MSVQGIEPGSSERTVLFTAEPSLHPHPFSPPRLGFLKVLLLLFVAAATVVVVVVV